MFGLNSETHFQRLLEDYPDNYSNFKQITQINEHQNLVDFLFFVLLYTCCLWAQTGSHIVVRLFFVSQALGFVNDSVPFAHIFEELIVQCDNSQIKGKNNESANNDCEVEQTRRENGCGSVIEVQPRNTVADPNVSDVDSD